MNLRDTKILVTGGAGFIGSHLTNELLNLGSQVTVYDNFISGSLKNLSTQRKNSRLKIIRGNIRNKMLLVRAMKNVKYVFHEAALPMILCEQNPQLAFEINVLGSFQVCQAARQAKVKKIIAASSSSVYGQANYFPTDENHPLNANSIYAASKIGAEQIYKAFYHKYKLDYIGLRYLNIYGPRQSWKSSYSNVILKILDCIQNNQRPELSNQGEATLDLVYIDDVVGANLIALKSSKTDSIYNISSGKETSLNHLYNLIARLTRTDIQPKRTLQNSNPIKRRFGTSKLICQQIGWRPQISLEQGLLKTIEWFNNKK